MRSVVKIRCMSAYGGRVRRLAAKVFLATSSRETYLWKLRRSGSVDLNASLRLIEPAFSQAGCLKGMPITPFVTKIECLVCVLGFACGSIAVPVTHVNPFAYWIELE